MPLTTLRVFEHETIRIGARTRDGGLVPETVDLDALARFNDANNRQYFSLGWKSLTFSEWVGYLQVGNVAFEILPKADRDEPAGAAGRWKKALLEMLRVATGLQLHLPNDSAQALQRASLLELLVTALLDEVQTLLREGLARTYTTRQGNGPRFRGRLVVSENLRENVARHDRFFVRYTSFDSDHLLNRVVAEAVRASAVLPIAASLTARATDYSLAFADLSPLNCNQAVFDRLDRTRLGRSTARYTRALTLARILLEGHPPALSAGRTTVLAFLFDMNRLWESYVAALFHRARIPGLIVRTQESKSFWSATSDASPKTVRPDIVVRSAATPERVLLVVDTKWKVPKSGKPSDDDLKQAFVYNERFESPKTLLLYPSLKPTRAGQTPPQDGRFACRAHLCLTTTLGLFEDGDFSNATMLREVRELLQREVPEPIPHGVRSAEP